AAQGRMSEAEEVVHRVGGGQSARIPRPGAESSAHTVASRVGIGELFSPAFARRTLVLWVMWATMNFSYYGIFLWLPTQFVRKGFSLQDALLFNLIIAIAQIP